MSVDLKGVLRFLGLLILLFVVSLFLCACGRGGDARGPAAGTDARGPAAGTPEDRFARGEAELAAGRPWAGLWQMTRVLHDDPARAGALRHLGLSAYTQGRDDDVPPYLERLAAVRPLDRDELLALADASSRLNRFVAAESLFTLVLGGSPSEAPVWMARAWVRQRQGRFAAAAADYERAVELDPGSPAARTELAAVLLDLNRVDDARRALEPIAAAAASGPPPPGGSSPAGPAGDPAVRAIVLEARVLARTGDPARAAALVEQALERDPENVDALHVLAEARRALGDRPGARDAAVRHRAALDREKTAPLVLALKALVQGAIAAEAGDAAAALTAWEKGLEDDPQNLYLHCVLGPAYQSQGRRDEAHASFTVLRRATGGAAPGPLFLRTGKELRRRGCPATAVTQFDLAVRRTKGDDPAAVAAREEAIYFQALALAETGDWNAALLAAAPLEAAPAVE